MGYGGYTRQTWINNESKISPARMNHIEEGLYVVASHIASDGDVVKAVEKYSGSYYLGASNNYILDGGDATNFGYVEMAKSYLLEICFYVDNEWSGNAWTILIDTKGLMAGDKTTCATAAVGDNNAYVQLYGVRVTLTSGTTGKLKIIVADGSSTKNIHVTRVILHTR